MSPVDRVRTSFKALVLTVTVAGCGALTDAGGGDPRTAVEPTRAPVGAVPLHLRYAVVVRLGDTAAVTMGVKVILIARTTALPSDTVVLRVAEAVARIAPRTYHSPAAALAASRGRADPAIADEIALSLEDPRFRVLWIRVMWVLRGRTVRLSNTLCETPTQHLAALTKERTLFSCQPFAAGQGAAER
jgi:hypothetical protein